MIWRLADLSRVFHRDSFVWFDYSLQTSDNMVIAIVEDHWDLNIHIQLDLYIHRVIQIDWNVVLNTILMYNHIELDYYLNRYV